MPKLKHDLYSEWCPNCGYDVLIRKMVDFCPNCGERILCCSQCLHDESGDYNKCGSCPYEEDEKLCVKCSQDIFDCECPEFEYANTEAEDEPYQGTHVCDSPNCNTEAKGELDWQPVEGHLTAKKIALDKINTAEDKLTKCDWKTAYLELAKMVDEGWQTIMCGECHKIWSSCECLHPPYILEEREDE